MRTSYRLALALALAACGGGGGGSSSGPLSKHLDEMYVSTVPRDQMDAAAPMQNDWQRARLDAAHVDAGLHDAELQVQLAKNEVKGAKLKEDSARAEKKAADASADTNKINEAMRALRAAEKYRKAGQERVKYLEAYRDYMRAEVIAAQELQYWRESQWEVAKAKLARDNHIAPKGFAYDDFSRQEQDRGHRATAARDKAAKVRQKASGLRDKWIIAQREADTMLGVTSQLPDPMAKPAATSGDLTRGAGGITIGNGVGSGSATPQ